MGEFFTPMSSFFLMVIIRCLFRLLGGGYRRSHWFHTIAMSRTELDRVFNNTAMKKRCART